MNILVVNDDGIESKGIKALAKALTKRGDVYVSAPAEQQSGKSQSLSLRRPVKVEEVSFEGAKKAYKVYGTPADSTKMGLQLLREEGIEIDMVFSGINLGSNLGLDTLYSGTVGAAMEAAIIGYQAVAVSVDSHKASEFDYACKLSIKVLDKIYKKLPYSIVININTPNLKESDIKGVRHTVLGPKYYDDTFKLQEDGTYILEGQELNKDEIDKESDIFANYENYASITPLTFDYTHFAQLDRIREWDLDEDF